jgi:hypothetical protein
MSEHWIVNVTKDPDSQPPGPSSPGKARCTPEKVLTTIDDTVQWFSEDGDHKGQITASVSPFAQGRTWSGPKGQASQPQTVTQEGVFKYNVTVTTPVGDFVNDPVIIGTKKT